MKIITIGGIALNQIERESIMKRTHYLTLIVSLYTNFIFQGIATIIITQNMGIFEMQWSASMSQITLVVSAIGLGRILSLNIAGFISDVVGRKITVLIGTLSYIVFFIGILLTSNYYMGFIMALFAGFGNAFLDTSTYPVVLEAFPTENDSNALSVLNKSFISIGQFILPLVTRFLIGNKLYFGWSFIVCIICLILNFIFLMIIKFPERSSISVEIHQLEKDESSPIKFKEPNSNMKKEGYALLIFSFVSVSLFNIFIMWIPLFAERYIHLDSEDSLVFVSIYSLCSFVSVFFTSFIVKKGINIPKFMFICTLSTGFAIIYMLLVPSMLSIVIASICVGFFAAGGIWQLGLSILLEFFPYRKGTVTSYYSLATSFSVMLSPYFTGLLAEVNIYIIFAYIILLVIIGCTALVTVIKRYQEVFSESVNKIKFKLKRG